MARTFCKTLFLTLAVLLAAAPAIRAAEVDVETNLLHWATATPNAAVNFGLGHHFSLGIGGAYNAFNFPNYITSDGYDANPKLHHWLLRAEGRFWFRRSFRGLYIGIHALGGQFNAGGIRPIPFLRDARYEGWGAGAGIGVGLRIPIGSRWGIGASAGAGIWHLHYTKYDCGSCGRRRYTRTRNIIAPTDAAISLTYLFSASPERKVPQAPDAMPMPYTAPADTLHTLNTNPDL